MIGADAVRDEITAQACAAARWVPEVDTVFEIGGQDSKYTKTGIAAPIIETLPLTAGNPQLLLRALLTADLLYQLSADERESAMPTEILTEEELLSLAKRIGEKHIDGRAIAAVGTPMCETSLDEGVLNQLEGEGERILRAPLSEYLLFLWQENTTVAQACGPFFNEATGLIEKIAENTGENSAFSSNQGRLHSLSDTALDRVSGGNVRYRFAKTVESGEHCDAVLSLAPRYENAAMVMEMRGLREKVKAPLYPVFFDGDWDETAWARLRSFLYYAKMLQLQPFESAQSGKISSGGENMNDTQAAVFSLAEENPPVPGCTISGKILRDAWVFSLAKGTDISPESYPVRKLWFASLGSMKITGKEKYTFCAGQCALVPTGTPVGIEADTDSVYTEIMLRKESIMNPILKDGEVFCLKDLLPYQEGKIVNMDIIRDTKLKFVVMAFDEGTGLTEHAAPGEAIIFALDGKGIIGYEGKEYSIKAGENFKFAKNGAHFVKADGRFKMALLLTLD